MRTWTWLLLYLESLLAIDVRVVYLTSPTHWAGPYDPPSCLVAAQLSAADVNANTALLKDDNLIVKIVGGKRTMRASIYQTHVSSCAADFEACGGTPVNSTTTTSGARGPEDAGLVKCVIEQLTSPSDPIAGFIGPGWTRDALQAETVTRSYSKPLIGVLTTNPEISAASTRGWFGRVTFSQTYQANIIIALMQQMHWSAPGLIRHSWGLSFQDKITLLGMAPTVTVETPCCTAEENRKDWIGQEVFQKQVATGATVWILWTDRWWADQLESLNKAGMVIRGISYIVYSAEKPRAGQLSLANGLLCAAEKMRTEASFTQWWNQHEALTNISGPVLAAGQHYEAVQLYAAALNQLGSNANTATNGDANAKANARSSAYLVDLTISRILTLCC